MQANTILIKWLVNIVLIDTYIIYIYGALLNVVIMYLNNNLSRAIASLSIYYNNDQLTMIIEKY